MLLQFEKTGIKIIVMMLCIIITAFTLNQFSKIIQPLINAWYNWKFEMMMVTGQLLFQLPFIYKNSMEEKLNYFLNMLLISLAGSILLVPMIVLNVFYETGTTMALAWFFAVVAIMFLIHKKRVAALKLPFYVSYTWLLYRAIFLIFIIR
jgi:hypothetical protein